MLETEFLTKTSVPLHDLVAKNRQRDPKPDIVPKNTQSPESGFIKNSHKIPRLDILPQII